MALSDYKAEQRTFELKGCSFTVKGLSLTEFTVLVQQHMPDLEAIFRIGQEKLGGKSELTEGDVNSLVIAFAEQAPGLVANVIALASGESGQAAVDAARSLPFPVQVSVVMAVVSMTFDEVGGVKKAMESVVGLLETMKNPTAMMTLKAVK